MKKSAYPTGILSYVPKIICPYSSVELSSLKPLRSALATSHASVHPQHLSVSLYNHDNKHGLSMAW